MGAESARPAAPGHDRGGGPLKGKCGGIGEKPLRAGDLGLRDELRDSCPALEGDEYSEKKKNQREIRGDSQMKSCPRGRRN